MKNEMDIADVNPAKKSNKNWTFTIVAAAIMVVIFLVGRTSTTSTAKTVAAAYESKMTTLESSHATSDVARVDELNVLENERDDLILDMSSLQLELSTALDELQTAKVELLECEIKVLTHRKSQ
tara:strand:+ start:2550 stop:2921 length:372 start_codon:yes stop_codon:yes gene_type:complete